MFRNAGLFMATIGLLALAVGCSDDDVKKKDTGGGVKLDGGGVTLDQGGGGNLDTGGGGKLDTGGGSGQTCAQIASCVGACGSDNTCASKCVSQGTTDAQKKFQTWLTCINNALTGTCKTKCANRQSTDCSTCIKTACSAEASACSGGGTPGTKGFGDACGGTVGCKTGFICAITQTGSKKGFCSKKCTTSGQPCTGSPSGTESYCLLSDGKGSNYCVFLCKYKGSSGPKTVPCPTGLTCGTKENPAGSGQYSCVPK